MARLAFCDYHNMIAILEKYEHNVDFHKIVDFVEASHIRRNLKLNDEAGISSLPYAELFENLALMGVNSPSFSGRTVPQFDSMLVHQGEGLGTPTVPHHTPSPEVQQSSPTAPSSPTLPPATTATIPTVIPTDIPTLRQYSRRARIAQSLALSTTADEPASPLGDDSQGEAFPTVSGLKAEQDRENIIKTSTLPRDSPPRVTSLVADEGSMQHKLQELTDLCTRLQRQQDEMASKINAQDLEISTLKARIKLLEDKDGGGAEPSGEDATIKARSLETGEEAGIEKSTERDSNDTEELVNVLTSLDAASILTSRVQVLWSTARIETTDEGTKILATVDGKPITIFESSIRRNLKLKDEAGISSLPDAELFENLTLMGQYIRRARIAQSLAFPTAVDEPTSPLGDDSQGEACPTIYGLKAEQDRANIIKTSTLPHDSPPRVTSLTADEG
nr:hypothetical protein [Tanacetum cinerariifolium]